MQVQRRELEAGWEREGGSQPRQSDGEDVEINRWRAGEVDGFRGGGT